MEKLLTIGMFGALVYGLYVVAGGPAPDLGSSRGQTCALRGSSPRDAGTPHEQLQAAQAELLAARKQLALVQNPQTPIISSEMVTIRRCNGTTVQVPRTCGSGPQMVDRSAALQLCAQRVQQAERDYYAKRRQYDLARN